MGSTCARTWNFTFGVQNPAFCSDAAHRNSAKPEPNRAEGGQYSAGLVQLFAHPVVELRSDKIKLSKSERTIAGRT
jgi:hypothetical protein